MSNIIMADVPKSGGGNENGIIERTISEITNDTVNTIGMFAFGYCSNLTTASFPAATNIGTGAFYNCQNLTTVNFPAATNIGQSAFNGCRKLTTVNFPAVTSISSNAFYDCQNLTTVSFPAATSISANAFGYCSNLTTVNFPAATNIGTFAFQKCTKLISLYLMGSSFVSLVNTNAFSSTPISNYTTSTGGIYGSIYVPASMLESYKTRANWSAYSSRFVGIE